MSSDPMDWNGTTSSNLRHLGLLPWLLASGSNPLPSLREGNLWARVIFVLWETTRREKQEATIID